MVDCVTVYRNTKSRKNLKCLTETHRIKNHNEQSHYTANHITTKMAFDLDSELRITFNNLDKDPSSTKRSFPIPNSPESEITQLWDRVRDIIAQTPQKAAPLLNLTINYQASIQSDLDIAVDRAIIKDRCEEPKLGEGFHGETIFELPIPEQTAKSSYRVVLCQQQR